MEAVPQILAVDACHFETQIPGHILGASFLDAARHIVFLAWGISVENENRDNWESFLSFISHAFESSGLESRKIAVIGDRGKGLVPACQNVFNTGFQYHCIQHITENVRTTFNANVEKLFRARPPQNREQFCLPRLLEIQAINPAAAEYIRAIDPRTWTKWAAPLAD